MPAITAQNRKWWVVIAMSGVMILLTVDFFGITVALPRIGDDLDASTTTLLGTLNVYLLAFVSPMIDICAMSIVPALWGRRAQVPEGAHPNTAHPLWASLWRRHHPRVPTGSTPAS